MQVLSERMKHTALSIQNDHTAVCFVPAIIWFVMMCSIIDNIQMLWRNMLPVVNDIGKGRSQQKMNKPVESGGPEKCHFCQYGTWNRY